MMKKKSRREYGTEAQGSQKITMEIARYGTFEVDKADMDAILAKYRELGIRKTEEEIVRSVSGAFQREARGRRKKPFARGQMLAFWDFYRNKILTKSPEEVIALVGFDPRNE
jgi:hypothetical protein